VCDEYFVPTIEVISTRFGIPEDVAGATVMALGCNGPELFINTVSLFKGSDLGVGAVLGGEVFNLLVLCGCAVIATPAVYLPLRLPKFSFCRDVLFYAASVGLIYWVLCDNKVSLLEASLLLVCGAIYSTTCAFSSRLRLWLSQCGRRGRRSDSGAREPDTRARPNRTANPEGTAKPEDTVKPGGAAHQEGTAQPEGTVNPEWTAVPEGAGGVCTSQRVSNPAVPPPVQRQDSVQRVRPADGCLLSVRVRHENRLMDRCRHWDMRYFRLVHDGLLVSTDVLPLQTGRTARGIVYQHGYVGGVGAWHHGGLVNAPIPSVEPARAWSSTIVGHPQAFRSVAVHPDDASPDERAANAPPHLARPSSEPHIGLDERPWELIAMNDIVSCIAPVGQKSTTWELHILQRESLVFGKLIRLELDAKSPDRCREWVAAVTTQMQDMRNGTQNSDTRRNSAPGPLRQWVQWFQFPVQFLLRMTIPDVKKPSQQRWFPVAFLMSMVWLAIFSYCVVQICDILHAEFDISVTILGFTVAAVGTSFPNVISCIAVSRQGKTGMAIANALGANIQNVFLALALPWTISALISGTFEIADGNITTSVVAMIVTLVLLVLVVLAARCSMPMWSGFVFLLMYALYLALTIVQEVTCDDWPFPC